MVFMENTPVKENTDFIFSSSNTQTDNAMPQPAENPNQYNPPPPVHTAKPPNGLYTLLIFGLLLSLGLMVYAFIFMPSLKTNSSPNNQVPTPSSTVTVR